MNKRIGIIFFVLVVAMACSWSAAANIQKSPNDHRNYHTFELNNQLEALVISDPEAQRAAVSMSVLVGGGSDPEGRNGMAHFLEHMLFLGTEKYPQLDGYRAFIEQNGGSTNAYTSIDLTNYQFTIEPGFLHPALDRFAQFFIAPLFPINQVDRERTVVHAEFEMRKQRDSVRRWSAMRQAYNSVHPSSKFISGNEETLSGDIRAELVNFFETHYSADLMTLVVIGRESTDQLQVWVEELFSDIRNTNAEPLQVNSPLFAENFLPALLQYKTLKNNPKLTLMFPVQNLRPYWRESPSNYIGNILGHEGTGSLLSQLKRRGWADGLYVGSGNTGLNSHTVSVVISLTRAGLLNWENIGAYVFQYIRETRQRGVERWRFEEQKLIADLNFRFAEIDSSSSYATALADALHFYSGNNVLRALYLVEKYDPELIDDILSRMNPENVFAILTAPTVDADRTTPYVGSEYSIQTISSETVGLWNADIDDASGWLPQKNEFLPQNLEIQSSDLDTKPKLIVEKPGFQLWFDKDTAFSVPRANFYVSVRSPLRQFSVINSVLLDLFVETVDEQLNEYSYPAALAGLSYSLYPHSRGMTMKIAGYDDKQSVLLTTLIKALKSPKFDSHQFEIHRAQLIRDIQNRSKDEAYHRGFAEFYSIMLDPIWRDEEKLKALESISLNDLREFADKYFDEVDAVALSHGNVSQQKAMEMGKLISENLLETASFAKVEKTRVLELPESGPFVRAQAIENSDSAISVYIQGADRSLEERAKFGLLAQTMQTTFFSELRSVQQLGYVVFSSYTPLGQIPGVSFVVQSPQVNPIDMEIAIDAFLDQFHDWLTRMPQDEFEGHREGLIARILRDETNLTERSERYWIAIDEKDFEFSQSEKIAEVLASLDRQAFENFVADLLDVKRDSRLVILSYGSKFAIPKHSEHSLGIEISDTNEFKRQHSFFPLP